MKDVLPRSSAVPPLELLQELLNLPALDPARALTDAATSVARWLECDKTDVFLYDAARSSLVALGTSETPLGRLERSLGMDLISVAHGGRSADVFRSGVPHVDGHVELDEEELRGMARELGVRSQVVVPLSVAGARRGVLMVVSQQPERFGEEHLRLVEVIAGWIGALVHRAELVQQLREEERRNARRVAADEVVSVLAHDVWGHLNPLSARLQMLQIRLASGESLQASDLDRALLATQRLGRLAQDLLDSTRLEHGLFELELAPLELSGLLSEVARLCQSPGVPIEVQAPSALTLIADGNRLRQALENVVLNGTRHSPRGSPVQIAMEVQGESGSVTIRIADRGAGIAPTLLPRLFERFVAEGPGRGLGLGLYLARRIALAHGGDLQVFSEIGAGTQFAFVLPLAGPQPT